MESILDEIREERKHQDNKWGGADHDDTHDPYVWTAFITTYLGHSISDFVIEFGNPGVEGQKARLRKFRYNMVKVASLAVAAIESIDRKLSNG